MADPLDDGSDGPRLKDLQRFQDFLPSDDHHKNNGPLTVYKGGNRASVGNGASDRISSSTDENDGFSTSLTRRAVVETPLLWSPDNIWGFAPFAHLVALSRTALTPHLHGSISANTGIRPMQAGPPLSAYTKDSAPQPSKGFVNGKVEVEYQFAKLDGTQTSSNDKQGNEDGTKFTAVPSWMRSVHMGVETHGQAGHHGSVGACIAVPSPWKGTNFDILLRKNKQQSLVPSLSKRNQDIFVTTRYERTLPWSTASYRFGSVCVDENVTLAARQTLGGLVQWQSTLRLATSAPLSPKMWAGSLSSIQSEIPWNIQSGWKKGKWFGNLRITPSFGDWNKLQFVLFSHGANGMVTQVLWRQELPTEGKTPLPESNSTLSKPSSKKAFEMGVKTNWKTRRTDLLIFWSDHDFELRIPITLLPTAKNFTDCWLQTVFSALWCRVVSDVGAILFKWPSRAEQVSQATRQQQELARTKQKDDAMKQQHLMTRQAQSRTKAEGEVGLVIERAVYGAWDENQNAWTKDRLDVTVPLQFWVSNGRLELPASTKKDLLGFCDPRTLVSGGDDVNEADESGPVPWWKPLLYSKKQETDFRDTPLKLYVCYKSGGYSYQITFRDSEAVMLPHPQAAMVAE